MVKPKHDAILFGILFMIFIFALAIILVYTSQYNAGVIPIEDCAQYLGNTFCNILYNATGF